MFDAFYLHLFVWDAHAASIVGAYRLGLVDEILARYGKRGLYTHSLFKYRSRMLDSLSPAIELGRSFVRAEYQRSFAPLLLLWAGIGRFVERSPQYAVLFGPVSISARYAPASRRLIVEYLSTHSANTRLARYVRPRRPFRDGERAAATSARSRRPETSTTCRGGSPRSSTTAKAFRCCYTNTCSSVGGYSGSIWTDNSPTPSMG